MFMPNQGAEAPKQAVTYDFESCGHALAMQFAYYEVGIFREADTDEKQGLYDTLPGLMVDEDDGLVMTAGQMQEAAGMLREWGNANAITNPDIPRPRRESGKADTIPLRTVLARLAMDKADDMDRRVKAAVPVSATFNEEDFYRFLDGTQAA